MLRIAFDFRDGRAARPGGWGRYARNLARALHALEGVELIELARGWPGPEALWEQAGRPLARRRLRPDVVHATRCFLPLRRSCPGVDDPRPRLRGAPEGLRPPDGAQVPHAGAARGSLRRARDRRQRVHPRRSVRALRDRSGQDARGAQRAVAAALAGDRRCALRAAGAETPGYLSDASLDALVRGTAVAVAAGTALAEAGGDAAMFFDPLDVGAMSEALDRREELAARGHAHATAFSGERAARETAAVYEEVA